MINHIVLDFDSTIADSIRAITQSYEIMDKVNIGTYKPEDVKVWNFKDVIPHATNESIEMLFESDLFWNNLKLIEGAKEFIDEFKDKIVICSIGSIYNSFRKLEWINKNIGDVSCLPIVTDMNMHPKHINKDMINMENCIFIEDSGKNIDMCNAEVNILFSHYNNFDAEWAVCSHYDYKTTTWKEIGDIVRNILTK